MRDEKLKIDIENLEDQQVKLTVEVDSEQLDSAKRKAARKIARRIKIPGFRPGKAPYKVIQRQVGDEALLEEGLEILVNDIYPEVIEESEIEPYGPGHLENVVSLEPLTLEFIVPLMAEVELGDYHSIHFPYEPPEISEQDVSAVTEDFRQRQAVEESVERPAESGDHVYLKLSAKRYEEENEGEEGNLIEERSTSVIIAAADTDTSNEWPFDGFSRKVIGMEAGEEKKLVYTFPEDSQFESMREVTAEFAIKVDDIKARILPELNDEFAQSIGEYDDLQALEKEIRESLEQRASDTYNAEYDEKVLDAIIESSTIKYPPQMLDNELNLVVQQLENRLASQGLDMEIYLKTREIDEQGLREEAKPVAEARVNRSLILLKIASQEEIDVDEKELQEETARTLDSITRYMSDSDKKQFDSPNAIMNLTGSIYAEMRMNRTLEYLRKLAKGDEDADEEQQDSGEEAAGGPEESRVEVPGEDKVLDNVMQDASDDPGAVAAETEQEEDTSGQVEDQPDLEDEE